MCFLFFIGVEELAYRGTTGDKKRSHVTLKLIQLIQAVLAVLVLSKIAEDCRRVIPPKVDQRKTQRLMERPNYDYHYVVSNASEINSAHETN